MTEIAERLHSIPDKLLHAAYTEPLHWLYGQDFRGTVYPIQSQSSGEITDGPLPAFDHTDVYCADIVGSWPVRYGMYVVGEAGAGKTTLTDAMRNGWRDLMPSSSFEGFSNSAAFRSITAHLLEKGMVSVGADEEAVAAALEKLKANHLGILMHHFVHNPRQDDFIRSKAVNTTIAAVACNPLVRMPATLAARELIASRFADGASAIVIDARNWRECEQKLHGAVLAGKFILTCAPEVAAERIAAKTGDDPDALAGRIAKRNHDDRHGRNDEAGKLTLPEDVPEHYRVHELLETDGSKLTPADLSRCFMIGYRVVSDLSHVHIASDAKNMTTTVEQTAVAWMLRGALTAELQRRLAGTGKAHKRMLSTFMRRLKDHENALGVVPVLAR